MDESQLKPYLQPRVMPSEARLQGVKNGLRLFGLATWDHAVISEYAAIESMWIKIAAITDSPLPDVIVRLVQRRTHRMLERRKSGAITSPTSSPERMALQEVYQDLREGILKYQDGRISR